MTNEAVASLWSSGGGTQSCAIAALIVEGVLPTPSLAAIADTHYEQSTTWDFLERVVQPRMPFEIVRVPAKDYATVGLYGGKDKDTLLIPAFTNQSGEPGKLPAFCSNEWKRRVIERWARKKGANGGEFWIGFSTDELERVKPKKPGKWSERYPLIELRMNRGDCIAAVLRVFGELPPRSSCWMCPNHTQAEWQEIKSRPGDWNRAVKFDRAIRERDPHAFLHSDFVPLEQADLDDRNESLFRRCDSGMCFV
jgi:hypothetical protein